MVLEQTLRTVFDILEQTLRTVFDELEHRAIQVMAAYATGGCHIQHLLELY